MMAQASSQLIAELDWRGQRLRVDLSAGRSIAIPLMPNGPQPAFFAPGPMTAHALQLGGFTGDVQRGGSCNVRVLDWAPHCHGTHTECIGHILAEEVFVLDVIDQAPCLARLVSLRAGSSNSLISLAELQAALPCGIESYAALVVRTLPNPAAKCSRDYSQQPDYPVLGADCMKFLAASGLRHLLLDTPSLDSADNATLANHRTWWGLDSDRAAEHAAQSRSVTEMIFVPDDLADGDYWLDIQLSALQSDATPSRPVLYPVGFAD
jgi:kynurenine formamidase